MITNSKKIIYIIAVLLVAVLITISFLRREYVTVKSPTYIRMGTTVNITAVAADEKTANKAIEQAVEAISATEKLMSYYDGDSQLSSLNKDGFQKPVKVGDELFEVINKSIEFNKLTYGAFDCTIAPVLELWRSCAKKGIKPTEEELAAAKAKTGCDKLIIEPKDKSIRFAVEGMKLDLGGIAKGYGVDKAINAMRASGAVGGLIDAGGDIRCYGTPAAGQTNWIIGLQNPDISNTQHSIIRKFAIDDMAITTSGDYYRFVVVDGEKISHIIDPSKSKPAKELCSVSVIAPDATTADALSTAVTVLGKDKGIELIESLDGIDALLITSLPQEETFTTSGIKKYFME